MSAVCVCSSSVRPVTTTSSVSAPTLSCRSTCARVCTLTRTSRRTRALEALQLGGDGVGADPQAGKDELAADRWSRSSTATPVPSCVAITVTPGSTAPLSSVTRPTMTPVSICAKGWMRAKGRGGRERADKAQGSRRRQHVSAPGTSGYRSGSIRWDAVLLPDRVDAQLPGSDRREIQKDEAVEHRELTAVLDRPEALAAHAPGSTPTPSRRWR